MHYDLRAWHVAHRALAEAEAEEGGVDAIEVSQRLRLERPAKVPDGHHTLAPGGSLLAQRTHPIVYPLQSTTTRSPLAGLFPRPTVAS